MYIKQYFLLLAVLALSSMAVGQCRWEPVLPYDVDNQIYDAVPYKGGLAVIVRGDYYWNPGSLQPPVSYVGMVQGDTLDTLIGNLGPQSGNYEDVLISLVAMGDSLFVLGNYSEMNGVPVTSPVMIYTDTGIFDPHDFGMTGGTYGMQKDPNSNTIIFENPTTIHDSSLIFESYINLYRNSDYTRYDTIDPAVDPRPKFQKAVLYQNEVIAYNVNQDYDGGKGLYYLNRDSLKWKLEKSFTGEAVNMAVWQDELYVTNSDNKIWKKGAAGWSIFYTDTVSGNYFEDLYVFKDELYVARGELQFTGNKFIRNILVNRSGMWLPLFDSIIIVYNFRGFTDDGSNLIVFGESFSAYECSFNYPAASILRLVFPLAINAPKIKESILNVYPNPANTTLMVTKTGRTEGALVFFNTAGVQIKAVQMVGTIEVDVSSWPAGVYFYRMGDEVGKVVIAR